MDEYTLDDFLGMKFYMLNSSDFFEKTGKTYEIDGKTYPIWSDKRENPMFTDDTRASFVAENGTELVISGIVRPRPGATATSISGAIGYTKALTDMILDMNTKSEVINQQKETPEFNVLTGLKFERTHYTPETIDQLIDKINPETMAQFYPIVTQMILKNPEFAAMLDVKDANSLLGVLFLMPTEQQTETIAAIVNAAKSDPIGFATLCGVITQMSPDVNVTADNFLRVLPIMSQEQLMVALMGIPKSEQMPMHIKGIIELAGDAMTPIYTSVSESLKTMEVNEEIFERLIQNGNAFIPDFATSETFLTLEETLYQMATKKDATLESNLKLLGDAEAAAPASINFYAKDFESKDNIEAFISEYNDAQTDETKKIEYTDIIGIMMSSVSIIINVISYVLIAFVSISLVVSSIMIGIITYISVLERTKEIGILRSIGASKKDISRVFNAETLIVGLTAGVIGIGGTLLLCIPINAIIHVLTEIPTINAVLPFAGGVALILISMLLTFIAGLIPSGLAAKKDPVEALRSE
jgi:putative ABC transport system permease protein